jgi:hypothetical protein
MNMPTTTYDVQIKEIGSTVRVSVVNKGTPKVLPPGTDRTNIEEMIRAVFLTPGYFDIVINEIDGVII